jgi:transposase
MLIGSTRAVRVWAWPAPVDLRRGFDGLFGLVARDVRKDPLSGELFLFANKRRTGCKVLFWDGTGLCLFVKRLERGRFASLWRQHPAGDHDPIALTASELALYIEGSSLVGKIALSPTPIVPKSVAVRSEL